MIRLISIISILSLAGCADFSGLAKDAKSAIQDAAAVLRDVKNATESVKEIAKAAANGAQNSGWMGAGGAIVGALAAGGGAGLALRKKK